MTEPTDLPDVPEASGGGTSTLTVDDVTEAMKDVVDPELGINVVDLGLLYGVHVEEERPVALDDERIRRIVRHIRSILADQPHPFNSESHQNATHVGGALDTQGTADVYFFLLWLTQNSSPSAISYRGPSSSSRPQDGKL